MTGKATTRIARLLVLTIALWGCGGRTDLNPPPVDAPAAADAFSQPASSAEGLAFLPNRGQVNGPALFHAQGHGFAVYFLRNEARLVLSTPRTAATAAQHAMLALRFIGARPDVELEGGGELPGEFNFLRGRNASGWQTHLHAHEKVVYHDLWPGVDLTFGGEGQRLGYQLVVQPGARVDAVRFAYAGASGLALDSKTGSLRVQTPVGELVDDAPTSYQLDGDRRIPVASKFVLEAPPQNQAAAPSYGFSVGPYDPTRPLIIDPALGYSTFVGGSQLDQGLGVSVDALGHAYVAGPTDSPDMPTTPGAFELQARGANDAYIAKLSLDGRRLVYLTYVGGSLSDEGEALSVDSNGNAYLVGVTGSTDFPVTANAFQSTFNGSPLSTNAFLFKLDPSGATPLYSTYLGGSGLDAAIGVAIDASANVYLTGQARSPDFPITPGAFQTAQPPPGAIASTFAAKFDASGNLVYSTYLNGTNGAISEAIAADAGGNAYVVGVTGDTDFPTTPGAFSVTNSGGADAFLSKLNPTGTGLVYSTYLGGSVRDFAFAVSVDPSGSAYVAGSTDSADFPVTPGTFNTAPPTPTQLFITKFNTSGSGLVFSTTYGGHGNNGQGSSKSGIAVDPTGNVLVAGSTNAVDLPTTPDAVQPSAPANTAFDFAAFVAKLDAAGATLRYGSYLGGSQGAIGTSVAVDPFGNGYVAGYTRSPDFPTTHRAFDTTTNGSDDAFVTKIYYFDQVLADLIGRLVQAGALKPHLADPLLDLAELAIKAVRQGNAKLAALLLDAFQLAVRDLAAFHVLTPAQAQPLIDVADGNINQLR